jgi:hypothetical protein
MAMTDQRAHGALLFAGNGANRPLHQDRQVLRAGDLALEQATQDAMLARARRYLHGWGVVAGLVPEVTKSKLLTIGPGYGVTPLGDELFLPEPVSLPDAADAVVRCCGPGPLGCEVVDPEALAAARAAAADITVTAWLIARPASREAAPRPGVPEGCAHPASTLLPSRRCGGVEFAILCTLPPSHVQQALDCKGLMPFVCASQREPAPPLPWETLPGSAENFLVIARLTVADGALAALIDSRRTLWPIALIQDWIASCLCPVLERTPPTPPTPPAPPVPDQPREPGVGRDELAPLFRAAGPTGNVVALSQDEVLALRDRLAAGVTGVPGIGDARTAALAKIGVTTEGQFLTAPPARLAEALKLKEAEVVKMKEGLSARLNLGLSFR